ncbi:hypothetical protein C1H46_030904 [Malus baccata]|uniref:Uncharacterized protein n=1 Tax=Malus baccata TaxID=106549 RepID=A0A540LAM6_MALBA|nr:hypothetical protein C1H46_030904 [Malus baccata]
MRGDIALPLQSGHDIRVEHVFKAKKNLTANEFIELFCELVVSRLCIIVKQRECLPNLKEGIASIIFASSKCSDILELIVLRNIDVHPGCGANPMLWCEIGHMQFVDSASVAEAAANSASDTMAAAPVVAYLANKDSNQFLSREYCLSLANNIESKVKLRDEGYSQLLTEVHKFADVISEFNNMVSSIPPMVTLTQSNELKLKFDEGSIMSKLWIMNLGGNERLAKAEVQGENRNESQNINKSLLTFGDVISALSRITALNRFRHVDEEKTKAISLFEKVMDLIDAIEDEVKWVEDLIRGITDGNIFDLGFAQFAEVFSNEGMSFFVSCQNLVPRPWVIDDLDVAMGMCVRSACGHSGALDHGRMGVNQQQNNRVNYWLSRLRSTMKFSTKEITFDQHLQYTLQGGIDKRTGVIGLSFGPKGRNVVLDKCGSPKVVNEGVKFGKAIELPHDIGIVGEAQIREVFSKTNDFEGDRTTNTLKKGSECTREILIFGLFGIREIHRLVMGAVENLLEKSTKVQLLDDTVVPLDNSSRNYIVQALHEMSTSALKPLNDTLVLKLANIGIAMSISKIENISIRWECAAAFKQVPTFKFFSLVDKANFHGGSIVMNP